MVDLNYDRKHAKDLSMDLDEVIRQFVDDHPDVTIQSLCVGVGWTLMALPTTMHEAPIVPVPPSQPGATVVSGEGVSIGSAIEDLKNKVRERMLDKDHSQWEEKDGVIVQCVDDTREVMLCVFNAAYEGVAEEFMLRYVQTVPVGRKVRFDITMGKGATERYWSTVKEGRMPR